MGTLIPGTVMDLLSRGAMLTDAQGRHMLRNYIFDPTLYQEKDGAEGTALIVSMDFSNSALKATMPHRTRASLTMLREPVAYWKAPPLGSGRAVETARCQILVVKKGEEEVADDSNPFWFGNTAVEMNKTEELPVGHTYQRTKDKRLIHLTYATLAKLLREAGYGPGSYKLLMALGVPNNESIADKSGKSALHDQTREAMQQLRNQNCRVTLDGEEWNIQVINFVPYGQSMGTYFTWSRTPTGENLATRYKNVLILDYGHGHRQRLEVTTTFDEAKKRHIVRSMTEDPDDGIMSISDALASVLTSNPEFKGIKIPDAFAREALRTGEIGFGGQSEVITPYIEQVKTTTGENIFSWGMGAFRDLTVYVINTGGGVPLFGNELKERLVAAERRERNTLIIPDDLAVSANSIGGILAIYVGVPSSRLV
jgi:hypothetical protein